jgi:predicted Zn-ribbon and HTH transcriptional regulator
MHGFDVDEAEVAYWGRCPDCKRTSSDETKVLV